MRSTLHPIQDASPDLLPTDDAQEPSAESCAPTSLTATVKEVAALLGVSDSTVYRMVRADTIPFKRVGRRILIPRDELAGWLADDAPSTSRTTGSATATGADAAVDTAASTAGDIETPTAVDTAPSTVVDIGTRGS